MDQSKIKPALISGVIFGVVSLIPFVGALNCCCGWLLVCGVVAVKMYSSNNPNHPIRSSEGAMLGAMSGAVAAIIIQMVNMILNVINYRNVSTEGLRELFVREIQKQPNVDPKVFQMIMQWVDIVLANLIVFAFIGMIVGIIVMTVFGALGGLIGVSLFNKGGKTPPPNTPPYNYGESFGEGPKSSYPGQ